MAGPDGFIERTYSASDGLRLSARLYGDRRADRLPAICLAGLTRNARDFHEFALALSRHPETPRQVIAFDYRGRGRSAHDRDWRNYDVRIETQDLMAGLAAFGVEHAAFVGTSRGGLLVFALTALRPTLIRAVVLNDIGPVIEGAGLAQIRAWMERAPSPASLEEAAALHKAAAATTFPALGDDDWQRTVAAFYRLEDGRPVPDFDPALMKTLRAVDFSSPLPVFWPQFAGLARVPLMAIRGANSPLLSAATLAEMQRRHPAMLAVTVPGQGHAPLLETAGLPDRVAAFLARADQSMND